MAHLRKQDEQNMINNMGFDPSSQISSNQQNSVSNISRRDLRGVLGNESSANFETSMNSSHLRSSQVAGGTNSQMSNKITSNIDSIYGFYKKKGEDDDCDEESQSGLEQGRQTSHFEGTTTMGNYVPVNQMLDLRLLNAELNADVGAGSHQNSNKIPGSGKSTRNKQSGNKQDPVEIFSFKQLPVKRSYQTLNRQTLWNANPLNRKYGLEMSVDEKSEQENFTVRRGGQNRVIDNELEAKDENSEERKSIEQRDSSGEQKTPGMIFSNKPQGPAGIGKMSEYAKTGIYIDPNQISQKKKKIKKIGGRDIKYSIKDLEAASFMDMDDFMGGGLAVSKPQKPLPNEEQVEDQITETELENNASLLDQAAKNKRFKRADDFSMPNFQQNVANRNQQSLMESQDFKKQIKIFFKDCAYPLFNMQKVIPPQHQGNIPVRSGIKLEKNLNYHYRDFLINHKDNYNQQVAADQQPIETRVLAIERRFGMTSLILKDPEDCNKVIKLLLNPIYPEQIKLWENDKVLISKYKLIPLTLSVNSNSEFHDEMFVSKICVPLGEVLNLSTKTDIETNTDPCTNTNNSNTASIVGSIREPNKPGKDAEMCNEEANEEQLTDAEIP